jgi:outer membrane protein assembly factor BamB
VSGKQIYKKRIRTSGVSSFVGSPVAANGYLFMPAEDGKIFVIRAGDKFEQLHQNELGEYVLSTPAICRGVVFVRGEEHLFALADKGENVDESANRPTPLNAKDEAKQDVKK